MFGVMSIAASGMQAASARLEAAATRIASSASSNPPPSPEDLAQDAAELAAARVAFMANAAAFHVSSEMVKQLYETEMKSAASGERG